MKSKQPDPNLISLRKKFRKSVVKDNKASKSNYFKKSDHLKKIIFDRHLDLLRFFVHPFDL